MNNYDDNKKPSHTRQVGGNHYIKHKIQPWDVIDEYKLSYHAGSALSYIMRYGDKGEPSKDIAKAIHYLEHLLELLDKPDKSMR